LTAANLIEFFKVLPVEEQKIFMGLAEKEVKVNMPKLPKIKNEILTQKVFKKPNS
jgi:hypothetical protein